MGESIPRCTARAKEAPAFRTERLFKQRVRAGSSYLWVGLGIGGWVCHQQDVGVISRGWVSSAGVVEVVRLSAPPSSSWYS